MRRHEPCTGALRAGFVMWSVWVLIYGVAYGEGPIHTYYVVTLGPASAAICGAGLVHLWPARVPPDPNRSSHSVRRARTGRTSGSGRSA
jgi:hypothetical protein